MKDVLDSLLTGAGFAFDGFIYDAIKIPGVNIAMPCDPLNKEAAAKLLEDLKAKFKDHGLIASDARSNEFGHYNLYFKDADASQVKQALADIFNVPLDKVPVLDEPAGVPERRSKCSDARLELPSLKLAENRGRTS